ncbi:MAG: POTRA domain-containing protein, partial [Rhodothermales bacterium]
MEERRVGNGVYLAIRVKEEPRLVDYTFTGIKKGHAKDLQKEVPLIKGTPVRPSDIERTKQQVKNFLRDKGYMLATVAVQREETDDNHVRLNFIIDRGPKVEIEEIEIKGNEAITDRRIKRKMKDTDEDKWWRFWGSARFDRTKYEEDLQRVIQYYNDKGYYDARIVSDTVFVRDGEDPGVVVHLQIAEGPRFRIRNVDWEGNTVYTDEFLTESLGFSMGDVFERSQLEENLHMNRNNSDVSSLYMNRGYMRFQVEPRITVVEGDSLDLHFDIMEGDVYEFGDISIVGNTKTKEHVVRRELYTVPGQTFSRDTIQESIRRLSQLNYFTQESLAGGPGIDIDEETKSVDLTYTVAEASSDQLELSGTWGSFGLVLMLRFSFNNFSAQNILKSDAWDPLPSGDGQKLSLAVQTNGTFYQNYSLSFTEPWFKGRP